MQKGLLGCGFIAGHSAGCLVSAPLWSSCLKVLEKFQNSQRSQPHQAEHQLMAIRRNLAAGPGCAGG